MTSAVDRISAEDAVALATDVGPAPMHAGALLVLDGPAALDLHSMRALFAARIESAPRLRRRLLRPGFGGGRAVWVDDEHFDIAHHVHAVVCPGSGEEADVLEVAADALAARLSPERPLWRAVLVTDLADGGTALVLVMHHVLADGIGGLAVLAQLADGAVVVRDDDFPRAAPTPGQLRADAVRGRWASLRRLPTALARTGAAVRELRGGTGPRAGTSSLLQATGVRRRVALVHADLGVVHAAGRARGATVNDVVLVAVAAALHQLMVERGEELPELVASIPVSGRRRTSAHQLGNEVGAVPIRVRTDGGIAARVQAVAAATRAAKEGPRGASSAVLGPVFRALSLLGLFRPFIEHQRLVHTFVTNLRGPDTPMSIGGTTVREVVPLAAVPGDVTVTFAVLSYAGCLGITIIADAVACPDLARLQELLAQELRRIVDVPTPAAARE